MKKTEQSEQNRVMTAAEHKGGRRQFLRGVGTLAVAALSVTSLAGENRRGPRELPLHEADFYAPHSDAG